MIRPARQYMYPQTVAGEDDAMARGALLLDVRPAGGRNFLAICALGFAEAGALSGVWSCPDPAFLCAVAGGYAYLVDTRAPQTCTHLDLRPVAEVRVAAGQGLLLFAGFHHVVAWGADGLAWQTRRLTWEGLALGAIDGDTLHGFGWDLHTDKEIPFSVNLRTGHSIGGSAP